MPPLTAARMAALLFFRVFKQLLEKKNEKDFNAYFFDACMRRA
jgi:hypothetical protein